MIFGFIIGAVIVVLGIVAAFAANYCIDNNKSAGAIISIIAIFALVVSFIIIPFSFHTVDTGEIAVVKHFGEAKDIRAAGLHWDAWITNKYEVYDSRVQKVDITASTYSSDAQTMDVSMTLQYQIQPDKVLDITRKYGSLNLLQQKLESIVIEKTKATLSCHKAMNIIADRAAMSPAVEEAIKEAVDDKYFVDITSVVLTNIDFSDSFEKAVEDKMIAEQKQLQAEYENQTKIARAEADAKAKLVEAEAARKANELLQKSLTDKVLRQEWIDKWDGKLPTTTAGDSSVAIVPN